jgi:hypothetical protein
MNHDAIVKFVQTRTGEHSLISYDKASELMNLAHAQILEEEEWSRKYTEILIRTPADDTTGTFAITNGSSAAVGTGLTLTSNNLGWYIHFGSDTAIYVIGALTGATITLYDFKGNVVTYAGETASASTFVAFKRWHTLGEAIEGIEVVTHDRTLSEITTGVLDDWDRDRSTTSNYPDHWAYGPRDSNGFMQIEFWPRANTTLAIRVKVRRGHIDLKGVEQPFCPWYVIGWKAAAEACLFLQAKTNQTSWFTLADKYEAKYVAAVARAMQQDQKKSGLPHRIKDVEGDAGIDDDFYVRHDNLGW